MRDAAIVAEALAEATVTVDWAVVTTGTGEDTGGFRGEVPGGFSILVSSPIHSGVPGPVTVMPRGLWGPRVTRNQPICERLFPDGHCSN